MVLKGGFAVGLSDLIRGCLVLLVKLKESIQVTFHGLQLDLLLGLLVSFCFVFGIFTIFFSGFLNFAFFDFIDQRAILFPFDGALAELDVASSFLLNSALGGADGAGS